MNSVIANRADESRFETGRLAPRTPVDIVARAVAIAETLVAQQAETEKRTYYSEETHETFRAAGFYRLLVPRTVGGMQQDLQVFFRVIMAIARGCPSTAWQLCFGASHAATVCAMFDENLYPDIFGDGHFVAATTVKPQGILERNGQGDWVLNGTYNYCSGIPYSTHFLSQAFPLLADGTRGAPVTFLATCAQWEMLDDWGDTLGLKGSGSHSIRFKNALIPQRFVLQKEILSHEPAAGQRTHGESALYYGRTLSYLMMEPASIAVGSVKGALDEYMNLMRTKLTMRPPIVSRSSDPDYRRWLGNAIGKLGTAEAAALHICEQWTAAATRNMTGESSFSTEEDLRLILMSSEVVNIAWDVMQEIIWRTAGSSPARDGERMQRAFRDVAMIRAHAFNTYFDVMARELSDQALGTAAAPSESFSTRT